MGIVIIYRFPTPQLDSCLGTSYIIKLKDDYTLQFRVSILKFKSAYVVSKVLVFIIILSSEI